MTDRDRLIELLKQVNFDFSEECVACCEDGYKAIPMLEDFFADYLLANGVRMLPIPIGAVVYEIRAKGIRRYNGRKFDYAISSKLMFENAISCDEELYVKAKVCTKTDNLRIGKTVFLNEIDAHNEIERRVNRGR